MQLKSAGLVLLYTDWHAALIALPGFAMIATSFRKGARDLPVLLGVGLAASGVSAFVTFWAYWIHPWLGSVVAPAVAAVSFLVLATHRVLLDRRLAWVLAVPAVLWVSSTLFILSLGFLHGGQDVPLTLAQQRWSGPTPLPPDNTLPLVMADHVYSFGHAGSPMRFGDWLSSDRPPLQSGFALAGRLHFWDVNGLHYEVLGVLLQQLWVVALWGLLVTAGVTRWTRMISLVTATVSDVAIVNGFYVWPKLLPAAYLLAAAAVVLSDRWARVRQDWRFGVLIGSLLALAMLGHGGSIFGILPLAVVGMVRACPTLRWFAAASATMVLLMLPWALYQRYIDPPGNRLLKWHLAGVENIDDRGVVTALRDQYAIAGLEGTARNKAENFSAILGPPEVWARLRTAVEGLLDGRLLEATQMFRDERFFYLVPCLGLLVVGPFALGAAWIFRVVRRRNRLDPAGLRSPEARLAWLCLATVCIGCISWGLLMFGPRTTVIHQGSLLIPVLAMVGCVTALCAVSLRLSLAIAALHVVFVALLYGPTARDLPVGRLALGTLVAALAVFGVASATRLPDGVQSKAGRDAATVG